MLRAGLLVVGVLLAAVGLALRLTGASADGNPALICGAVVLVAVLGERWRYRRSASPKGERWQKTGERFEDPDTGRTVEVLYNPVSGERRYVPVPERLPPSQE